MSAPFVTPSNGDTMLPVKQEPIDVDFLSTPPSVQTPHPPSLPSPIQLPMLIKFNRHETSRSRTYDKPHNCCEVCQGEFNDTELLLQHKLLHFNTSHICYICDCYFVNTSSLIMHIATNHRSLNPAMTGRNDPDRSFVCSICLQRFSSSKTLQRHQEVHKQQDERSFACKICGHDFIGYRALVPHLTSTRHKEMKIKIQSIFVCVDCRAVFPSRDSYAMHMMLRAQNETCSVRCVSGSTTPPATKTYSYPNKTSSWAQNGHSDMLKNSTNARTDARGETVPLNLSVGHSISPSHAFKGLTCVKCGETVPDEEALALHLMVHVRESTEKPFYLQQNNLQRYPPKTPSSDAGSTPRTDSSGKRPDSAPVENNPTNGPRVQTHAVWPCHLCTNTFDSCDYLAMHMMDHHTSANGQDRANNNKNVNTSSKINLVEESQTSNAGSQDDLENEMIPIVMPANQISFSTQSSPVARKRCADSDDDESSRPKRCTSIGSSIFACDYCNQKFFGGHERDSHVVNEHGVSRHASHCLACSIGFREKDALKEHLVSDDHQTMIKVQKTSCRMCNFMGSSSSHIREHESLHGAAMDKLNTLETSTGMIAELLQEKERSDKSRAVQLQADKSRDLTQHDKVGNQENTNSNTMEVNEGENTNNPEGTPRSREPQDGAQNTLMGSSRRSKRKPRISTRFIPGLTSPSISENENWMDEANSHMRAPSLSPRQIPQHTPHPMIPLALDGHNFNMWPALQAHKYKQLVGNLETLQRPTAAPTVATAPAVSAQTAQQDDGSDVDIIDYVLSNAERLAMCKYCKIIFTDQTMFFLHMGLHNLNDPWQCNLCGKANRNVHEFTSHVIHY